MSDSPRRKWAKSQILRSHTLPPGTFPTSAQIRDYLKDNPYPEGSPSPARGGPSRPREEAPPGVPPSATEREKTGAPSRAEKPKLREVRPEVFIAGPTNRVASDQPRPPANPETPPHNPKPPETPPAKNPGNPGKNPGNPSKPRDRRGNSLYAEGLYWTEKAAERHGG